MAQYDGKDNIRCRNHIHSNGTQRIFVESVLNVLRLAKHGWSCGLWHYMYIPFYSREVLKSLGLVTRKQRNTEEIWGVSDIELQLLTISSSRTKTGDKVKNHCSWHNTQAQAWFIVSEKCTCTGLSTPWAYFWSLNFSNK